MPVSGLVLTLDTDRIDQTLAVLARDPRVTLGPREGHRLALALETDDRVADERAWEELRAVPGVTWIDLAYITIDPDEDVATGVLRQRSTP
jgi:hypothetical protein